MPPVSGSDSARANVDKQNKDDKTKARNIVDSLFLVWLLAGVMGVRYRKVKGGLSKLLETAKVLKKL
jgi:hypothetical protein